MNFSSIRSDPTKESEGLLKKKRFLYQSNAQLCAYKKRLYKKNQKGY